MTDVASPPRLLVVDDEPYVLRAVKRTLGRQGCEVWTATDDAEAMEQVRAHDVDICLLDMRLQTTTGVDLMKKLQAHDPTLQCIIFTGYASSDVAYEALSQGAADYFQKPIEDWDRFLSVLQSATAVRRALLEGGGAKAPTRREAAIDDLLKGRSPSMKTLRRQVSRVAPLGLSVLILGPTGSGKSQLARALHVASGREGALEMINCALLGDANRAWSELFGHEKGAYTGAHERFTGRFEQAADGTVFLDEIGELPVESQATLLHVLEEGVYRRMGSPRDQALKARVVAATNRDLFEEADAGRFSDALLSRFDIVLRVPSLAERVDDIPLLTWFFLREIEAEEGLRIERIDNEVFEAFQAADWRDGNVRQLRNVLKRMAVFADDEQLTADLLPPTIHRQAAPLGRPTPGSPPPVVMAPVPSANTAEAARPAKPVVHDLPAGFRGMPYGAFKEALLQEFTASYLQWCLAEAGGNITRAADHAEVRRPNFKRLMKRFGVEAPKGDVD